jgi:hypothetical protein
MEEERERLGANSIAFWRFYKGFWAPSGATDGIYSEADIVGSGANRTTDYPGEVIPLVAIDPAFTNGGDRTMVVFGRLGVSSSGHYVLEILDSVQLNDDLTIADVPRTHQIVRQFIALCRARGIDPYNVAADATGAGSPFCDVLAEEWSDEILRIQFGGLATERAVSANDRRIGKDAFANRVTEIWAVGREFLRTNQLKGINPDIAKEMTSRRYKTVSAVKGMKLRIETKPEFKSRVGYSPDLADATFMLLDLARERHGFVAVEMPHTVDGRPKQREEASLGFRRINQSIARLNIESEMGILVDE